MTALEEAVDTESPKATKDLWFNPSLSPGNDRAHKVLGPVLRAMEQHGRKRA
jgi:hypothetical protein